MVLTGRAAARGHRALGDTLRYARHYEDAIAAYQASIAADPEHSAEAYALRGLAFYLGQEGGGAAAYQYAEIYAQWGDRKVALDWLEKAMRLRERKQASLDT